MRDDKHDVWLFSKFLLARAYPKLTILVKNT